MAGNRETVATLKIQLPDNTERLVVLKVGDSIKLGRDESCDIVLDDFAASRLHATFSAAASGLSLSDHSSLNGTFLNGERIVASHELKTGDLVNIGSVKIAIELKVDGTKELASSPLGRGRTAQLTPESFTILIATIPNYNSYLEKLPPNDVMRILEDWTGLVSDVVDEFEGAIDRVAGTSIVAIWRGRNGQPVAIQAAKAALEIRKRTFALSRSENWGYHRDYPWTCTEVLSSGIALKGLSGGDLDGDDLTFLGEPVAQAFKLEEMVAKLGQDIIISSSTANLLEGEFNLQRLISVRLRGSEDKEEVHSFADC